MVHMHLCKVDPIIFVCLPVFSFVKLSSSFAVVAFGYSCHVVEGLGASCFGAGSSFTNTGQGMGALPERLRPPQSVFVAGCIVSCHWVVGLLVCLWGC